MAMISSLGFVACEEESGTVPGNDNSPVVTIYQYDVELPYNADNDTRLRFAANNKVTEAYYVVEKSSEVNSFIEKSGKEAYMNHVVENGKSLTGLSVGADLDIVLTDIYGSYTIAAVAVNGNNKTLSTVVFVGLEWDDVNSGTYTFFEKAATAMGVSSAHTTLQHCVSDPQLYRFKDLYGAGYSLKFTTMPDYKDEDEDGVYEFIRVAPQPTAYTFSDYGTISVRDIGYWQGSDACVTDKGYNGGFYLDGSCVFLYNQYYVSAGNLGYGYDVYVAE